MSTRWPFAADTDSIANAKFIHARMTEEDEYALCEEGENLLPRNTVTLILDLVTRGEDVQRHVDCPKCLEWMHA